jgi:hypothetical protein
MMSKAVAFAVVIGGCVIAAAGGAFVASRGSASDQIVAAPATQPANAPKPVAETEAVVQPPAPIAPAPVTTPVREPVEHPVTTNAPRAEQPRPRPAQVPRETPRQVPTPAPVQPSPTTTPVTPPPATETPVTAPRTEPVEPVRPPEPPAPQEPELEEVIVPASSVIGLQVSTALSTERSQVEDRVEARVTRDVMSGGRLAIPAGSRVIGSVTTVERGGKVKDRARLGLRFHTLVLADGREIALRTDSIYREGDSPTNESARKIGGAAIGGAILGAIIGGGKGAAIGGATGAAGGTAVVMTGDRNPATLAAGSVVTVRLTSPIALEVRKNN